MFYILWGRYVFFPYDSFIFKSLQQATLLKSFSLSYVQYMDNCLSLEFHDTESVLTAVCLL